MRFQGISMYSGESGRMEFFYKHALMNKHCFCTSYLNHKNVQENIVLVLLSYSIQYCYQEPKGVVLLKKLN